MVAESVYFKCPVCASVFSLEKKAIRGETFLCPVCQEGEIESCTAQPVTDQITKVLTGEPASWVVMLPHVETVSRS
jgi:transcription initiation factor IIE alpha subunit